MGFTPQPIGLDLSGVVRFKPNPIVLHLLKEAEKVGCDLNRIAQLGFDAASRRQFAQLIGYSVSGYGELNYVPLLEAQALDTMSDLIGESSSFFCLLPQTPN